MSVSIEPDSIQQARRWVLEAFAAPSPVRSDENRSLAASIYGSRCPLPPWQFELTAIARLANRDLYGCLMRYLYHPKPEWSDECDSLSLLWKQFSAANNVPKHKERTLSALCYLALQNYRHILFHKKPAHSISRIIELSKVSQSNWRRDWRPIWIEMNENVALFDIEALTRIYNSLDTE